ASCVDTVYFQPEQGTLITVVKADPLRDSQITIDGSTQYLNDTVDCELTVLRGQNGVEHPAFAWMKGGCIHILGFKDQGYLVKICGWSAKVMAYHTLQNSTCGLCGNYDGEPSNDIRFRDGIIIDPPQQRQIDSTYGND
ncbi:unnamed protein product, partial [Meganyctiphanes norvegica]